MPRPSRVTKALETAQKAKVKGASQVEAGGTAALWRSIADDPEASSELASRAVWWRRELEAAVVNRDASAQDAAIAALVALAVAY
jgi:hypothetical protein